MFETPTKDSKLLHLDLISYHGMIRAGQGCITCTLYVPPQWVVSQKRYLCAHVCTYWFKWQ
jgi:hypothetical protein